MEHVEITNGEFTSINDGMTIGRMVETENDECPIVKSFRSSRIMENLKTRKNKAESLNTVEIF